jgi:hypothetical protein
MLGIKRDHGDVMIVASSELSYTELRSKIIDEEDIMSFFDVRVRILPHTVYELNGELRSCVFVVGKDWAEAIERLFGGWSPDTPNQRAIPTPTPELPTHSLE